MKAATLGPIGLDRRFVGKQTRKGPGSNCINNVGR